MKVLEQRIISGNSYKVLPELINRNEVGTYNLCMTSPPYWNLVEYNAGDGDLSMIPDEEGFTNDLTGIYKYISRLLSDRGTLVSQWEDLTIRRPDGRTGEYMLSCINDAAERSGMTLYARWIWKKFTKKPTYMPSSYDMASSGLARPNPNWSYAFVYKKDMKTNMNPEKTEVTKEEWSLWSDGVWDFPNPGVEIHKTPFAPELVDRFLKLYTKQGDRVIDPFGGSGTTLNQCIDNCRACTIIELDPKYIPGIKERVGWGRQCLGYKYEYKYEDLSKL